MPGSVITFYSYKGGTGRTMALANTAVLLAQGGARVLAIDWDLEAPGLHRFLHDGEEHKQRQGLIELFTAVRGHLPSAERGAHSREATAGVWSRCRLDDFIVPTQTKNLSVMRAGTMDDSYTARVNAFEWERLYYDAPHLFSCFAETLAERYDYVLVDSRTGITDSGGICTMLLPDRLVLVFTPNRQSLDGIVERARQATAYRARSADLRPLLVLPLASRVELSEEELRHRWRHGEDGYQPTFEGLYRELYDLPDCKLEDYFDDVQIQHAPRFAYGEPLAVLEESASDRLSLARSYASFTRVLVDGTIPWEFRRSVAPASVDPREEIGAQLERTIEALARARRRTRMLEVQARIVQAAGLAAGLIVSFVLLNSLYYSQNAPYAAAAGVLLAGIIEGFLRLFLSPSRARAYGRAASALAREQRLYHAFAGPYAGTATPDALLVERTDEILATVDDDSWALARLTATPTRPPEQ